MSTSIFSDQQHITSPTRYPRKLASELKSQLANVIPVHWLRNGTGIDSSSIANDEALIELATWLSEKDFYSEEIAKELMRSGCVESLKSLRQLQFAFGLKLSAFATLVSELTRELELESMSAWREFAETVAGGLAGNIRMLDLLKQGAFGDRIQAISAELEDSNPHAIFPTSSYRTSNGQVVSNRDCTAIEAVMSSQTHTSIRVVENALNPSDPTIAEMYRHHGRCVCLIDQNVYDHYGVELEEYFQTHHICLEKLIYRAMEADKGVRTVEKILADFKSLGVARNEPVLVVGGGVLTDVGGLACGLYHRGTPYVMLSTSLVAGVDAGPSPRTCCDGFGFKNLFGTYHAPLLSITDRTFFSTLKPGWLRHGIAEIIKMACVKDEVLFAELELAGKDLISTRFGTVNSQMDVEIQEISQRIIGRAITSYVDAEYGNLYETHQCRPHAFGHTWSPGFEIPAGLLHGHAVSIGMGFGTFLSYRLGWVNEDQMNRIHGLIQQFGLSLWHDQLNDHDLIWAAQTKMVEKRGGQLVAPLPLNAIGQCGYLADLGRGDLVDSLKVYRQHCQSLPGDGLGIEPLCSDVGLESPSTVGC